MKTIKQTTNVCARATLSAAFLSTFIFIFITQHLIEYWREKKSLLLQYDPYNYFKLNRETEHLI